MVEYGSFSDFHETDQYQCLRTFETEMNSIVTQSYVSGSENDFLKSTIFEKTTKTKEVFPNSHAVKRLSIS